MFRLDSATEGVEKMKLRWTTIAATVAGLAMRIIADKNYYNPLFYLDVLGNMRTLAHW